MKLLFFPFWLYTSRSISVNLSQMHFYTHYKRNILAIYVFASYEFDISIKERSKQVDWPRQIEWWSNSIHNLINFELFLYLSGYL